MVSLGANSMKPHVDQMSNLGFGTIETNNSHKEFTNKPFLMRGPRDSEQIAGTIKSLQDKVVTLQH